MSWIEHTKRDPWNPKTPRKQSLVGRCRNAIQRFFEEPLVDEERAELEYLRDLHCLCEDMRTAMITMGDVSSRAHRIQSFLRLKESMSWNSWSDYGQWVDTGKHFKEAIRK